MKIKPSRNDEITLSFTDAGRSGPSREILKPQIYILTLFAKLTSRENFRIYSNCRDIGTYRICEMPSVNAQADVSSGAKRLFSVS